MSNFGKPIQEMSDEELLVVVNRLSMDGAQVAMGELNRRSSAKLKESMDELNTSTEKYSVALIALTLSLFIVSFFQFLLDAQNMNNKLVGVFYILVCAALVYYLFATILKKSKKEKE